MERIERGHVEGSDEYDLRERSLDFGNNVLYGNFEAAKEDHDFIRDWKP